MTNLLVALSAFWALFRLALLFLPAPAWVQRNGWWLLLLAAAVLAPWLVQQEASRE